ncbi:MAG TPA: alpha/beta hydrolase [Acidimicrobiales bacterium]|nr:alpha/beta hydrolase [Acidimicrobiales bacterium]
MAARVIDVGEGMTVAVDEAGAGERPLLVVHGFTGGRGDFADHLDALAEAGWWVVAPDLRGHGDSAHPLEEGHYSLDHFATDVWRLVDALGWERLVLLGHSMGGMIAQVAALDRPHALDGLVLMDTTHGPLDLDRELAALGQQIVRDGGMAAVKEVLDAMGDEGPLTTPAHLRLLEERPGYREEGDRKFLGCSPSMYAAMLGQLLDQVDRLDRLAALDLPALVIVGEQDAPFLGPSRSMAEAMPNAELVVVPDAGHSPQLEHPEAWRAALLAFLAER